MSEENRHLTYVLIMSMDLKLLQVPSISHLYMIWIASFESTGYFTSQIFKFKCKFVKSLLHNWNYQLLSIVLN